MSYDFTIATKLAIQFPYWTESVSQSVLQKTQVRLTCLADYDDDDDRPTDRPTIVSIEAFNVAE
jgi:hypothetical protein